jgi:molybdenum cofactor biosynthesis enzyme MoaA
VLVNLEQSCQIDCVFCRRKMFYNPEKRPRAREVLESIFQSSDESVTFSGGGEPTMEKFLPEYIRFAKRAGKKVMLETNGIALSEKKYAEELASAGLEEVCLTLPSHIPEIYDEIVQTPGAFKKIEEALKNLKSSGIKISHVNIPSTKLNMSLEHFKGLWNFLQEHGERPGIGFNGFRPNVCDETTDKYMPDYDLLGKELSKILSFCKENKIKFGISPTTPIPPCKVKGFEKELMNNGYTTYYDYKALFQHLPECEGCTAKPFCIGVPKNYLKMRSFSAEPITR